jgi:hypothetical protein
MRRDRVPAFSPTLGVTSDARFSEVAGPRLTIKLVPETCMVSSVRDAITPSAWDRLRRRVDADAGHRCEVCDRRPARAVECDELWEYDDESHVQRLVRMVALCSDCHRARQMDRVGEMRAGRRALEHLARVNDWSAQQAERYRAAAFRRWRERSRARWSIDLDALRAYGVDVEYDV